MTGLGIKEFLYNKKCRPCSAFFLPEGRLYLAKPRAWLFSLLFVSQIHLII
jgi:hypothetical protein